MAETVTSTSEANYNWLDKAFLEMVLRDEGDPNIIVNSYEVKPATAAGDNYSSDISRVKIKLTRGKSEEIKSLIFKRGPEKEITKKMIAEIKMFHREGKALSTLLPEIHRIYEQIAPGKFQPLSPKCYFSDVDSAVPIIVMEDLQEQGFKLVDRKVGLDSKHSILVMRALARLHAASVVLHERKWKEMELFYETTYKEALKNNLKVFFENGLHDLANEVEKWPDYNKRFTHKLHRAADEIVDFMFSSVLDYKELNVLAHGDCFINNMMFRYSQETGEVEDIRLIDYQASHFTNPGHDFMYFLYTSTNFDVMKDTQFLIEEYYNNFKEYLILFGYKHLVPSFPDLLKRIDKKGKLAVAMSGVGLAFTYADEDHVPDTEKLLSTENNVGVHFSEKHKEAMKILLPIFGEKGWL